MGRTPFVPSGVCPSWTLRIVPYQSKWRQAAFPPWLPLMLRDGHAETNHPSTDRYMNMPQLIAWLSSRQYAPEGGFSGRTNKLVDGCYSHWVGGCWPLIQAALSGPNSGEARSADQQAADTGSLFSRNGLIRYILCCCQDQTLRGGLRDKPSK